jgi:hypothetical protein
MERILIGQAEELEETQGARKRKKIQRGNTCQDARGRDMRGW